MSDPKMGAETEPAWIPEVPEGDGTFERTSDGKVRRRDAAHKLQQAPGERLGRDGPEPTRYGDWEKKGIVSDF